MKRKSKEERELRFEKMCLDLVRELEFYGYVWLCGWPPPVVLPSRHRKMHTL